MPRTAKPAAKRAPIARPEPAKLPLPPAPAKRPFLSFSRKPETEQRVGGLEKRQDEAAKRLAGLGAELADVQATLRELQRARDDKQAVTREELQKRLEEIRRHIDDRNTRVLIALETMSRLIEKIGR
ncbi:MAG: hypothetical protein HY369_00185 [Candidatus Aenigmarchaeota archaeon]|nr:hypothetical protein [Candidatus Aenigmarchaeota archaeon]